MLVIGIAGGTGSGKTTLAKQLADALLPGYVAIIPQDSYYKSQWDVPEERRKLTNFDHPDAFDWPLLAEQIDALRHGRAIEQPTYSFITSTRQEETVHIEPCPVIIIEGILAFHDARLRDLMDIRVFVDTPADERLLRVIERDMAHRGHPLPMLIDKYRRVLRPMHDAYVEPTRRYADLIIPSETLSAEGTAPDGELLPALRLLRCAGMTAIATAMAEATETAWCTDTPDATQHA